MATSDPETWRDAATAGPPPPHEGSAVNDGASNHSTADVGGVAVLTLARPGRLNAIDAALREAIRRRLVQWDGDPAIKAVVMTGEGRAFSAGQDLDELAALDAPGAAGWITDLADLYDCVRCFTKPIVAAVNGIAAGAGLQIALHCDLRIGSDMSRMAQTEINVGLPSILGPWVMNRIMGVGPTLEMCLTGRLVGAAEALQLGLLNRLVAPADLVAAAVETARGLADKPSAALAATKQWIAAIDGTSWDAAAAAAAEAMRAAFAAGEPQRAIALFRATRDARRI